METEKAKLYKFRSETGINRMFKVFFEPDLNKENFEVGMAFHVVKVNRSTGEVLFSLDFVLHDIPE